MEKRGGGIYSLNKEKNCHVHAVTWLLKIFWDLCGATWPFQYVSRTSVGNSKGGVKQKKYVALHGEQSEPSA